MTNIDHDKIEELISDGYIKKNYHKNGKLFMYTYTTKTQYENMWVPETIMCRGIIFDLNKNLIARPFPKFFNLNQYNDDIPLEPFTVYEKVDGSLGILYFHEEKPYIATKGSFDSDQALIATDMLHKMYTDSISYLNKDYTYLFEIIYPENRIIVNYGDKKSLTLLGVIDTSSGKELDINDFSRLQFPIVKKYEEFQSVDMIKKILNEKIENQEGFVIHFKNGLRIKCKYEEYIKLHSFVSKFSIKKIWEMLKDNISFEEYIDKLPDELYQVFEKNKANLIHIYQKVEREQKEIFFTLTKDSQNKSRKELAFEIRKTKYPFLLFMMLDGKDYTNAIWEIIKPIEESFNEE